MVCAPCPLFLSPILGNLPALLPSSRSSCRRFIGHEFVWICDWGVEQLAPRAPGHGCGRVPWTGADGLPEVDVSGGDPGGWSGCWSRRDRQELRARAFSGCGVRRWRHGAQSPARVARVQSPHRSIVAIVSFLRCSRSCCSASLSLYSFSASGPQYASSVRASTSVSLAVGPSSRRALFLSRSRSARSAPITVPSIGFASDCCRLRVLLRNWLIWFARSAGHHPRTCRLRTSCRQVNARSRCATISSVELLSTAIASTIDSCRAVGSVACTAS